MKLRNPEQETLRELPQPQTSGGAPLNECLMRRRSCREFLDSPLSPEQISQLCWAAQGVTDEEGSRAAPSAGALFPLTLLMATPDGLFEYLPESHALHVRDDNDLRQNLQKAALDQEYVGRVPFLFIVVMDVERTAAKYGRRAERYCLLEAGHVAQNVLLEATAMGLGSVPVGAFEDRDVRRMLRLPANLRPVYLIPVGHPRAST